MKNIIAISQISFKEGLRHRVLYGVVIFAFLMMAFAVLISGLFLRDISKIIIDFCLAAINLGGLLVPFFLAVNLLAKDMERRTVISILSRSISRGEYILGKFGGLILLTGAVMAILTVSALLTIWVGELVYGSRFFKFLSIPSILTSIGVNFLGMIVLNALVVLWCSVTTSSFLATLLTLFTYLIGQTIDDVVRFIPIETPGVEISGSVKTAVAIAKYLFPNLSAFDFKLQAAHGLLIPVGEVGILTVYAIAYTTAVLSLSIVIFSKRDLA